MKLIFAQGNPGSKYSGTRHNIGFDMLDEFARANEIAFSDKSKFLAQTAELSLDGEKIILAKPTTFYNETGRSARAIVDFYKLDPASDLLVIHDDIALPFGSIRVRQKGSPAGNNGIKSLNSHIGEDYWRLRIGIYTDMRDQMHDADFVLSKFGQAENNILQDKIIHDALAMVSLFCKGKLEPTSLSN